MTSTFAAFAATAAVLVLAWVQSWWFLLALPFVLVVKLPVVWRRARILAILSQEYGYEFPATAPQAYRLNRMNEKREDATSATMT